MYKFKLNLGVERRGKVATLLIDDSLTELIELLQGVQKKERDVADFKVVLQAFGDTNLDHGVVEKKWEDESGVFTKYYGCSYIYNGYPDSSILNMLGPIKAMVSYIPRLLFGTHDWNGKKQKPAYVILFSILMMAIFKRKKILAITNTYIAIMHTHLAKFMYEDWRYCKQIKEVRRAWINTANKLDAPYNSMLIKFLDYFSMTAETDTAYRFRLIDILSELDQKAIKNKPIRELYRLYKIVQSREMAPLQSKWRQIGVLLVGVLLVSKRIKGFVVGFLLELDKDKVNYTESDWYYCLMKFGYNYKGCTDQDRLDFKIKLDKEKGHKIPQIVFDQFNYYLP